MSDLVPQAPRGWRVTGQLYDTQDSELLNDDMVELSHQAENLLIHAGWEPEEDVHGHYVIYVLRGCDIIEGPIEEIDIQAAAKKITDLAFKHSRTVSAELWFDGAGFSTMGNADRPSVRVQVASCTPRTRLIEREYA